jgi:hypothetical protein
LDTQRSGWERFALGGGVVVILHLFLWLERLVVWQS